MFMNREEFRKFRAEQKPRKCSCGCGKDLEPRVDGEREMIDGKEVNSDCYYREFGKELDEHPIGAARRIRP